MAKKNILFLCTHNSCRSQLAEAIVNTLLGEYWQAFSAGTEPSSEINPLTLQVLEEIGIQHSGRTKPVSSMRDIPFDLVVTVCDQAAEQCPLWLGAGRKVHMGFQDPASVKGSPTQKLEAFRKVRDEILSEIPQLLERYQEVE
jgi:arsenate reductase